MRTDILLNENFTFPLGDVFIGGVLIEPQIGGSNHQHIRAIILSHKGSFKLSPLLGFGASQYLNSELSSNTIEKNLNIELSRDDYRSSNGVISPDVDGFFINTDHIYEK